MIVAAFLFGGASRPDAMSQIPMRLAAIFVGTIALIVVKPGELAGVRAPLWLLGGFALIFAIQLVPLPPGVWTSLPGRELFAGTMAVARLDLPWHSISLIPESTWNALLATLPGFAALLALAVTRTRDLYWMVVALAVLALLSGIIGLVQISSGNMYLYAVTNKGSGVGVFANRNHQAALLALTLPTLTVAAALLPGSLSASGRYLGTALIGIFLVPLIVVTGSRAGLVLMLIGVAGALTLARSSRTLIPAPKDRAPRRHRVWHRKWRGVAAGAVAAVIVAIAMLANAPALERLLTQDIESDSRIRLFEPMIRIVSDFFPFGTGFGTFASIFKVFEPDWKLGPSYFNHAHNDVLEILIEGGLISVAIVGAGLAWWAHATWWLWRRPVRRQLDILGRLGTFQTAILALASLSDYPLRTPLCQIVFMLGCGCMALAYGRHDGQGATGDVPSSENLDGTSRIR